MIFLLKIRGKKESLENPHSHPTLPPPSPPIYPGKSLQLANGYNINKITSFSFLI